MKSRKRLIIGLLATSLAFLGALGFILWYLVIYRPNYLTFGIWAAAIVTLAVVLPVLTLGWAAIVLSIAIDKGFPSLKRLMKVTLNVLMPIALLIGRATGIEKSRVESSYIEVNNFLVRLKERAVQPDRLLVLLPHCLQRSDCPRKITVDVHSCQRCGKCLIGDLLGVVDRYGIKLFVASGGSQARRVISELSPLAVVAVACEGELTSGIQDVEGLPVVGITNEKPEGPCRNTVVDLGRLENAIQFFLRGKRNG